MSAPLDWQRDGRNWPHRAASRFVHAGGLRWHVQQGGPATAPLLLLLHGTGASTHSWRDLLPLLEPRWQWLAVDLPGHGFSGALPRGGSSLSAMAAALGRLLKAESLLPQAVLGHSAGAAVMLRAALDGHLHVPLLLGLNAALLPFGGWGRHLYAPMARLMAGSGLVPQLAAWRARDPRVVRRLIAATGSTLDDRGIELYQHLMRNPAHVANVLTMMADWDLETLQRDLPRVEGLHLIVGDRDLTVPPEQATRVAARAPNTTVHHLPRLGHLAHEEAPQVVSTLLDRLAATAAGTRR